MGALRYVEIKNVRESLNSDFINKELKKFEKHKKNNIIRIVVTGLFVVLIGIGAHLSTGWFTYFFMCIAILGGASAGYDLGVLNKRITIYNLLNKLSILVSANEIK